MNTTIIGAIEEIVLEKQRQAHKAVPASEEPIQTAVGHQTMWKPKYSVPLLIETAAQTITPIPTALRHVCIDRPLRLIHGNLLGRACTRPEAVTRLTSTAQAVSSGPNGVTGASEWKAIGTISTTCHRLTVIGIATCCVLDPVKLR